jgi:hypothetical protein
MKIVPMSIPMRSLRQRSVQIAVPDRLFKFSQSLGKVIK